MNLLDVLTRISDDANTSTNVNGVSARLTRDVNRISSQIWDGFRWSFRWRNYRIVTDIDYTTGTVTATNGSRTVTGSGTTFLSTHKNWHICFDADSVKNWYKVRQFTSATQIELDVPYQGTTGSSKAYTLRHFDYVLPTEIWDFGSIAITSAGKPLDIVDPSSLDIIGPLSSGYPVAASIYSSDSDPTTYSTGTISGTINTSTVTGSGTSWLDNVYPGDLMTIGPTTYTVFAVNTDTEIILYNKQQVTSAASTTYTITRQFGRILRIMWPSNQRYVLDIRALRKYAPLVNSNDTNELLYRYPDTVIMKASALELKSKNDLRSKSLDMDANVSIAMAKAEDESLTGKGSISPIFSYRTGNYKESIF